MRLHVLCLAVLLLFSGPAGANSLVRANERVDVADSALHIAPVRAWNRLDRRVGRSTEIWTLDGEALNAVIFYGGIQNDRPIFREVDRRNRPLPRFSSTMLLTDIPTLLENSYRIGREVRVFTIDRVEPAQLAGQNGVRFAYSFTAEDEVRRRGEAVGAIVGGRLYLITYEAPAIHFFDASMESYRQIIDSATMGR